MMPLKSVLVFTVEIGQYEYISLLLHILWQEVIHLEHMYSVLLGPQHAGKVMVQRNGLYYHFNCSCDLPADNIYRLIVTCDSKQENLGVLVPHGNRFTLEKKIPAKRIGAGDMTFKVIPKKETHSGTFMPISPEEPFAYISRLKQAFFLLQNETPGIYITKNQEQKTCS